MDKRQELTFLRMLDQGGLTKGQELNILRALDGDISGDEAMRDVYLSSLKPSQSFEEMVASNQTDKSSDSEMFDTETGITDSSLRRQLGGAETSGEQELVLGNFGFGEGDFIRNEQGDLALTPEGALLLGIETDKPIMIDESQFSISDIQDFVGSAGEEIVGGIAGAVAGQAMIPVPILGAMIGAFIGAGGGKLLEEGVETLRGTQEESLGEVAKDAAIEGAIAAAGEGIFGAVYKGFGSIAGRGRVGSKLPQQSRLDAIEAIEAGFDPSLAAIGAPSLISRQQGIAEKALGTSARLRKNNENIMRNLDDLRVLGSNGEVDVIRSADALTNAVIRGDTALLQQSSKASSNLLRHMDDIANNLGKTAVRDAELEAGIQSAFQKAFKAFDAEARIKYANIDNLVGSATGDARIFNVKGMRDDAQLELNRLVAAGGGNLGKVKFALQDILTLGDTATFSQLYKARKSLNDTYMANYSSDTVGALKNKFLTRIDNRISPTGVGNALRSTAGKTLSIAERDAMKLAAAELKPASKFFRLGMEKFEAVSQAASLKELSRTVKAGGKAGNPSEYFKNLVRPNNPQLLKDTKSVLPDGSYEPLRQRAAGEWLRKALSDSGVGEGAKKTFSGSRFKQKLDDLGTTADELFGKEAIGIKKLAIQLDNLSLTKVNQSVIDDFSRAGADDAGIDLLKKVQVAMDEESIFKKTSVNAKLRSGVLSAEEAADLISSPAMRGPDVAKLKQFFDDSPAEIAELQSYYMNNLIGDFEETFLTDKKAFKLLAKRFENAKKTGTLDELFGAEQAKEISKFGRIMNTLGKSAEGGDLVAANIAANPLENIGKISRFFIIGRVLSSPAMYKAFSAKYGKEAAKKKTSAGKMQVFLDVMNQTAASFAKQSTSRGAVDSVSNVRETSKNILESAKKELSKPNVSRTTIPQIEPLSYMPDMPSITQQPQASSSESLRDRIRANPALASTLLGGLGNAGLL